MACKGSAVRLRLAPPLLSLLRAPRAIASPSSRGLGHRPFTAVTGVRIPVGTPLILKKAIVWRTMAFLFLLSVYSRRFWYVVLPCHILGYIGYSILLFPCPTPQNQFSLRSVDALSLKLAYNWARNCVWDKWFFWLSAFSYLILATWFKPLNFTTQDFTTWVLTRWF